MPARVISQAANSAATPNDQIANSRNVPAKPTLAKIMVIAIWVIAMTCGGKPVTDDRPASTSASHFMVPARAMKTGRSIQGLSR